MTSLNEQQRGVTVEQLVNVLTHNDSVLSRTVKAATIDTRASSQKQPGLLRGSELVKKISENRLLVAKFIEWQSRRVDVSSFEHLSCLVTIAFIAGFGLLPASVFREWEYVAPGVPDATTKIGPSEIPSNLQALAERATQIGDRQLVNERLEEIAALEWEIAVGPLHPFYDGCGRVARYFSALMCQWNAAPLIWHENRDDYFSSAREGRQPFQRYYLAQRRV